MMSNHVNTQRQPRSFSIENREQAFAGNFCAPVSLPVSFEQGSRSPFVVADSYHPGSTGTAGPYAGMPWLPPQTMSQAHPQVYRPSDHILLAHGAQPTGSMPSGVAPTDLSRCIPTNAMNLPTSPPDEMAYRHRLYVARSRMRQLIQPLTSHCQFLKLSQDMYELQRANLDKPKACECLREERNLYLCQLMVIGKFSELRQRLSSDQQCLAAHPHLIPLETRLLLFLRQLSRMLEAPQDACAASMKGSLHRMLDLFLRNEQRPCAIFLKLRQTYNAGPFPNRHALEIAASHAAATVASQNPNPPFFQSA